ncbi:MAG TPA: phosphate ABC transporter substrate-binding protein [Methanothrix soehngenii]|jgi:phosphate transport system substrate-binding protein|uniref:phosphate ABC transporter substrate-binding protein n=1 Tax=Methanothrix TaxID=2222 RepID=UPI0023F3CA31|nr:MULTISPECIES: phosphate ABC transporter substrate-binding protein [Methanothrix]MDD5256668.1 phosphate ABC transporter substrate-binding protein [Methanothrix soehngenii]MDD5735355.1 phosphate ABC transporter substrate-binding protein [Methanothrix soehngenii]HOI19522.1 phosphate ABC transporter substrate-binding protein [Methanothrix soehngenii]HQE71047.1 phosphate ABC transporter substrate-binding protein [Methanothrix soehngenii]HQI53962.1 phosphate ABC transporter substrate-binding prot
MTIGLHIWPDNSRVVGLITKIIIILLVCLSFVSLSPCEALPEDVTIMGSSTVMPLAEAAAEVFNLEQNDYLVSVTAGGTGAGILGIVERKYDIAMASRAITEEEKQMFGDSFQEFKIGMDGISIAVSDEIYQEGVRDLSRDQVMRIYSGEITNWNEVGGPDKDIYVISREYGSGTRDDFNEAVIGDIGTESPGVDTVAYSGAEVKTAISGSDRAIGYLGFNYLGGGVQGIAFNGIVPSYENIKLDFYELKRNLYFYTFGDPTPGARAFIDFILGPEGQKIAAEEGFIAN